MRRTRPRASAELTQPGSYVFAQVRETDTYLVSFPRSGNTWLRCLVTALLEDGEITPALVEATVPDVHRSDRRERSHGTSGVVKSHTPFVEMPARVVYLVRDGRDAMLSFWAHQVAVGRCEREDGPGPFLLSPDVWPCPWHEHVRGWLDGLSARPHDEWLLLRYEQVAKDPAESLRQVAKLAGLSTSPDRVADAVRRCGRDELKEAEAEAGAGSLNHVSRPRPRWPDDISREVADRFMVTAGPALELLGYDVGAP